MSRSYHRLEDETSISIELEERESLDIPFLAPEYVSIQGFSPSNVGQALFILVSLLSGGMLPLFTRIYPNVYCLIARTPCPNFRTAKYVLVKNGAGEYQELKISELSISKEVARTFGGKEYTKNLRYFDFRRQRYFFKESQSSFQRLDVRLKKEVSTTL